MTNQEKHIIRIVWAVIGWGFYINFGLAQNSTSNATGGVWKALEDVAYKSRYDKLSGTDIDVPVFGKKVKELEGKTITLSGYIIPMEGYKQQTYFIFSAYPYNMCYFCGGAGPETVMEVYAAKPIPYTTKQITLKGALALNDKDPNKLMYLLKNGVLVSSK